MFLGNFDFGSTVFFNFTTVNSTGAPTAFSSGGVTVYRTTSTAPDTTGITLTSSHNAITGFNNVKIEMSTAGFYSSAGTYTAIISSGAASEDLTGYTLATWSLRNRFVGVESTAGLETASSVVELSSANNSTLVDAIWDEALTAATHNVVDSAGRRLRAVEEAGSYTNGAVFIDTVNGAAGTTDYENGTDVNPVNSIADANTIAASIGLSKFVVLPGSSITLAAAQSNQVFVGENWTLALGGQNVAGSVFVGAQVSGAMAGTGTTQYFIDCNMGATSLIKGTNLITCGIGGTLTVIEAGEFVLDRCHSNIAGAGTWIFEFGDAIGNTNLNVRNYSGGIQLESMGDTGTDTASIEGQGQIIEGTCAGGSVSVRGLFTVSGVTNITFTEGARIDTSQINAEVVDAIATDTYEEPSFAAGGPSTAQSLTSMTRYLFHALRNQITVTSSAKVFYSDANAPLWGKVLSDDGTVYTEAGASTST